MSKSAIATAANSGLGFYSSPLVEPETPKISPLISQSIKLENIDTIGSGNTPRLVYQTSAGRCSRLVSKADFARIWSCFLSIRGVKHSRILEINITDHSLIIQTNQGTVAVDKNQAKMFLSRYNRVALEPLQVRLIPQGAVVWNPDHHTLSLVKSGGCTCEDWRYRQTICKHKIAAQLCQMPSN
ncbi:hypothetical protein H4N54_22435 [Limnospira fusiformis KN01]|uniref:SWIM zinc finger family protein n=1 Tax=Limnospira fusiformis TaxID=54297 RepID=UPI0016587AE4|nr:SWIM zinc finger family protein [Limnospira fusiformis]ULB45135.1 hypothetical protein H4N54_22435 [Limnospira fusiformis KN01]